MILAMTSLLLALTTAAPVDVAGKWDGTITAQREDGSTNEDTALLILDQKDTTITGTVGGDEGDQHPITSGTIDGNNVTIVAKHKENGREYRLELTIEKDEMKGTLSSGARRAQIALKRRKA